MCLGHLDFLLKFHKKKSVKNHAKPGKTSQKSVKMLMNNGPWSPEHIYQEIAGYNSSRLRGTYVNSRGAQIITFCLNLALSSSNRVIN